MSILDRIIEHKRQEVEADKTTLKEIEKEALFLTTRGFISALRCYQKPSIIAEVKKASPSKGIIRDDLNPVTTALDYAANGAACISVLTDKEFFQGELDFLREIREAVSDTPLIRKDFIIDPFQVYETRAAGADAILLIASVLDDAELKDLFALSLEIELDVLLEIHNASELERALKLFENFDEIESKAVLGINNRDLSTFETDLSVSVTLLSDFGEELDKRGIAVVSESGIECAEDIASLDVAGVSAYLIGESLVRQGSPGENLRDLIKTSRSKISE